MKIEKLCTLSQFVDLMDSNAINSDSNDYARYWWIHHYNNFLKQPLKKEMFVNDVPHPRQPLGIIGNTISERQVLITYANIKDAWDKAEKKAIFRDFSSEHCDDLIYAVINKKNGHSLDFYNDGEIYYYDTNGDEIMVATLHDLAEATNGELELKNVEL